MELKFKLTTKTIKIYNYGTQYFLIGCGSPPSCIHAYSNYATKAGLSQVARNL